MARPVRIPGVPSDTFEMPTESTAARGLSARSQVLWVAHDAPWSPWSLSGINRRFCDELWVRGALLGAVDADSNMLRHFRRPGPTFEVERRVRRLLRLNTRRRGRLSERDGALGRALRSAPPGTAVVYVFLTPEIDDRLPVRRFRLVDIALADAARSSAYGHENMSAEDYRRSFEAQQRAFDSCDGVLTLSTYALDRIAEEHGVSRDRMCAVGAGPTFDTSCAAGDAGRHRGRKILFVGRNWGRKGGPLLLEAFRLLRGRLADATLTIVGPDRPDTSEPGVTWLGPIDKGTRGGRRRLASLFSESAVFCMPSECETWGLVYVEAMQAGTPVVGFDDWAMPDIVEHGVSGLLTRERTAEGLAGLLSEALGDPNRAARMGEAARRRVEDVLAWRHATDRLLSRVSPEWLGDRTPAPLRFASARAAPTAATM